MKKIDYTELLRNLDRLNPPEQPAKKVDVDAIFDKVVDIINETSSKTIHLWWYNLESVDELFTSSSRDAENAREMLEEIRHDIYLEALYEYNKRAYESGTEQVSFWRCSEDMVNLCNRLYEYVKDNFAVSVTQ